MRDLVKDLINARISRRGFLAGMATASYSLTAAKSALAAVEPFIPGSEVSSALSRTVTGTGADLLVQQMLETGTQYLFVANGSGLGPVCDSLVDHPGLQLIQATHEGQVVSIADGYAKASGKTAFGMYSRVGLPNSSSNMYNAMKDRTPLVTLSDHSDREGRDGHEDLDDWEETIKQYTKWRWTAHDADRIPEWIRKAFKVASVLPGGPTHVRFPRKLMYQPNVTARIYSGKALNIPMELRPDPKELERVAKLLLESGSPLMQVGFEVSQCHAQESLIELSELLAIPVVQHFRSFHCDFPNFHPLHIDEMNNLQSWLQYYPHEIDCFISFGTRFPPRLEHSFLEDAAIIHASVDPDTIGRNTPLTAALVGNIDHIARELLDAVRSMASPAELKKRTEERRSRCAAYTAGVRAARLESGRRSRGAPVPWQRIMYDLNRLLDKDAVIVEELGEAARTLTHFDFGPGAKLKIGRTTGMALGWGVGAAAGVKLALPDRQVIALQGDGGFMFGQTDSLWTLSRYDIPVMIVIINNRSYEATRLRIMNRGGRAGQTNRDYVSYLGNPDMDFAKLAAVYGIPGMVVKNSEQLETAVKHGIRTLAGGRPFMLDVRTLSWGTGANLTEYQQFSLAQHRDRKV